MQVLGDGGNKLTVAAGFELLPIQNQIAGYLNAHPFHRSSAVRAYLYVITMRPKRPFGLDKPAALTT